MAIPLLDNQGQIAIFKIHNLQIPYNSTEQVYRAKYRLESFQVAVNKRRTQFVLLSENEPKYCSDSFRPFCNFES